MSSLLSLPQKMYSALTSSPASPGAPVAVPASPVDNTEAQAERDDAANAALAAQAAAGRRSTIVAGASILDDQKSDLFAPAKRRAASRTLMG